MGGRRVSGGGARPRPMPAPAPNKYPSQDARGSSQVKPASSMDMRPASREKRGSVSHERRPSACSEPASPRRRRRLRNDGLDGFSGGGIAAAAALLTAASFLIFCLRRHFCHFLLNTEAATQKLPAISFRSFGGGFTGSDDSRSMCSFMAFTSRAALGSASTSTISPEVSTLRTGSTTGIISSSYSMTTGMSSSEKSSRTRGGGGGCWGGSGTAAALSATAAAADDETGNEPNAVPSRTRSRSSWWKSAHSVARPRTSHECLCGSSPLAAAAAAAAAAESTSPPRPQENDLHRRRSGGSAAPAADEPPAANGLANRDLMADVDLRPGAEAAAADASSPARRSRRQAAPPPPPPRVLEDFSEDDIPVVMEYEEEIMPVVEPVLQVDTSGEIVEIEPNAARDVKAMKEHMDLESSEPVKPPPKDLKEIAGSFWVAASVFSKKWQKWRRKQKIKKEAAVSKAAAAAMPPPEKPSKPSFLRRRRLRGEAGSEHALGRRSCDTDPRFSLDAGRMSIDDAGFSWDEPRASWDGYLFGAGAGIGLGRAPPPLTRLPPILSVMEDTPGPVVERSDGQIPVEDDADPGGSFQTRDYYLDSSSRRRRSLERTSSVRRPSFEVPELPKPAPAAAIGNESPIGVGGGPEFYHFHHAEDLLDRGFSSNSLVEDISASLEAALSGPSKKPPRWRKAWSLWGFIHRRAAGRRTGGPSDIADRSFSEPWPDLRVRGGAYNGSGNNMQRCNSNLSGRSSFSSNSGGLGSSRRSYVDVNGNVRRRGEELLQPHVLERNRSARHSPGRGVGGGGGGVDNGMLRFYLTPMRAGNGNGGARRNVGGVPGKAGRQLTSQSFARSVLRLY